MNAPAPRFESSATVRGLSPRAVILHPDGGRVLLLRRPLRGCLFAGRWEFPGGKPDPGEDFGETLRREAREETGLEIRLGSVLGTSETCVKGKRIAFLFIEAASEGDEVRIDPAEHFDHRWATFAELANLAAAPEAKADAEAGAASPEPDRLVPAFRDFALEYARRHGFGPDPAPPKDAPGEESLDASVEKFQEVRPAYGALGELVRKLLETHVKPLSPLATIGARTKSVASFAGKILRRNYADPLAEMTDLCGLRVVTQMDSEVAAVCRFIRGALIDEKGRVVLGGLASDGLRPLFVIDEKNSEDKFERLRRSEFGYRSVHFVASLDPRAVPADLDPGILAKMKMEIQVRTLLQHAWADVSHDRLYKAPFQVPDRFERESGRLAALLEDADHTVTRLVEGLEEYECHYGAYLDNAGIAKQIEFQRSILRFVPGDPVETLRLARLRLALETPEEARAAEADIAGVPEETRGADLWCALGDARRHQAELRETPGEDSAREAYRRALVLEPGHRGAMIGLASVAEGAEAKREAWSAANLAHPGDPVILAGFIRHQIELKKDLSFLPLLRSALLQAIEKCRRQEEVKVDLPWALYRMAGFQLLLGGDGAWEAYESLARAIRHDAIPRAVLLNALRTAESLREADPEWPGVECVRRMLLCAIRVKHPDDPAAARLGSFGPGKANPLQGPVVIVAGGCDPAHRDRLEKHGKLLEETFRGFRGTVLSGGTEEGVSGLVGALAAKAKAGEGDYAGIRAVGYLPRQLPADGSATRDDRYHELRLTTGRDGFSALEPLQNWIDLLVAGVAPAEVCLLGINGGRIARFEYLLAWALGARVALLRDSGRAADAFEADIRNGGYPGILILPDDAMSAQAFLHHGRDPGPALTAAERERLARHAHALFLEENRHKHSDLAMRPWETLGEDFRASNLDQIDHMARHLAALGYRIERLRPGESPYRFGPDDEDAVKRMARAEHGRWNVERLSQGWSHGTARDPAKKIHNCLVPWEELDKTTQGWDRNAVRRYPELLAGLGLTIRPPDR